MVTYRGNKIASEDLARVWVNFWAGKLGLKIKYYTSYLLWTYRKYISIWAFGIIKKTRRQHPDYYDLMIRERYVDVRRKEAYVFKTKIVKIGKGIKDRKMLMIETPQKTINIELNDVEHSSLFKEK